jgi:hypothetical protein
MKPEETDPSRRGMPALRCAAFLACLGTALALGGAAHTAAGPSLSFAAPKHYPIGKRPCRMAIGELNGDGKPDVVTTDCNSTVSVLLNRGDGAFDAKREYTTEHSGNIDVADLNGDGKNDLLTTSDLPTNHGPGISVLMNQGAGTFGASASYPVALQDLLIADLNGDDKPDLVFETGSDYSTVSVLLNHGDGTFEPKRDYLAQAELGNMALGDLNGDVRPDLVIVNPDDGVSVLLNGGDGSFQSRRDYKAGFPGRVAIGDLNGDGKPDLATGDDDGRASVRLNRGDAPFGRPRRYDYCGSGCNSPEALEIAIMDLNDDDKADLVTLWDDIRYGELHEANWYVAEVAVLLNKGDGRFSAHKYEVNLPFSRNEDEEVTSLAIGDLNGDGKPEITTATGVSFLTVQLNRGNGSFEPSLRYPLFDVEGSFGSADLNSDGRPDLVGANRARRAVSVRLNAPVLCNVQSVRRRTVAAAKRKLGRANCRVGKVTRAYEKRVGKGRVISQRPRLGAVLPGGAKVNLVVSRGRKRS